MLPAHALPELRRWGDRHPLIATSVECAAASAVLLPLHGHLALVNVAMLMLLLVVAVAARWGRAPAVLASLWYVLLFDIGFVPPRGSLHVHDAEYLIVFAVMLVVALLVSHFSGQLRDRERAAQAGEREQRMLYELAAELNRTLRPQQVVDAVVRFLALNGDIAARFLAPDDAAPGAPAAGAQDPARLQERLLPLQGATRQRGQLAVQMPRLGPAASLARDDLLMLVAGLMAAALERLHYLEVAARTQVEIESERLRGTLLASLSHDLRTPLTVLHARAEALREAAGAQPALAHEAALVCEEAMRANRLCDSLLDLARLGGAASPLRREWVALEEIIGAALASLRGMSGHGAIAVELAADLPWLQLDVLMFERVIVNLIDNAFKQGGAEQRIAIAATHDADSVILAVRNSGSRFPQSPAPLLQAFVRGGPADSGGFGLGLAICKAVVEAHGGQITLGNCNDGAEVRIRLPLPPGAMPQPPDAATGGQA